MAVYMRKVQCNGYTPISSPNGRVPFGQHHGCGQWPSATRCQNATLISLVGFITPRSSTHHRLTIPCLCERIGQTRFFRRNVRPGGGFVSSQVTSLVLFLYFWASPIVISKIPLSRGTNSQNKHRKTKLNNIVVILRVFILFSSLLTALNFDFSKASVINRYDHYSCTAHHTNRG